jgi:septal ring factor EnvC (AmiA/AmiB activator)
MDLSLLLGLVALVASVAALAQALDLRGRVARLDATIRAERQRTANLHTAQQKVHDEIARVRAELHTVQRDLDHTQRELGEVKALTEGVPAPPLPKTRSGGLDDLREQLRAAHREPDPTEDE